MKKLYLDVDGVILTKRNIKAALGSVDLLSYAINHYNCYWLTTHCRNGDTTAVLDMLAQYFPKGFLQKLKQIRPTAWNTLKTEGIDFSSDFYWLDDYVFNAEKEILKSNGCLNSLILVNLNNDNELTRIKDLLKQESSVKEKIDER